MGGEGPFAVTGEAVAGGAIGLSFVFVAAWATNSPSSAAAGSSLPAWRCTGADVAGLVHRATALEIAARQATRMPDGSRCENIATAGTTSMQAKRRAERNFMGWATRGPGRLATGSQGDNWETLG